MEALIDKGLKEHPTDLSTDFSGKHRRRFLLGLAGALAAPHTTIAAQPQPYQSVLWLRRGKEQSRFDFLTAEGYRTANYLLRDVQAGVTGQANPYLLYLLAWVQATLRSYGHDKPMDIHSGLRMPLTNLRTENAALGSRHLPDERGFFNATDVSIQGIPGPYISQLAAKAKYGGVGFYFSSDYAHVDIGKVRYWKR